ncbi:TPA: hypothetical protein ACH3X3_012512 [Trebouxia sp. C0006]
MVHTLQQKKAATVILKSLDLPADLRAKALACAASDSTAGHSLRDLIQLNDDDDLKPAIISFLEGQVAGVGSQDVRSITQDGTVAVPKHYISLNGCYWAAGVHITQPWLITA